MNIHRRWVARLVPLPLCLLFTGCADSPRSHAPHDVSMAITPSVKETRSLNTPWENEFGLVQGSKAGGVVLLAGQLSLVGRGQLMGKGSREAQMRQAYANVAKVLQEFNLTMNDVLEETLYVTDMSVALVAGPTVRREV